MWSSWINFSHAFPKEFPQIFATTLVILYNCFFYSLLRGLIFNYVTHIPLLTVLHWDVMKWTWTDAHFILVLLLRKILFLYITCVLLSLAWRWFIARVCIFSAAVTSILLVARLFTLVAIPRFLLVLLTWSFLKPSLSVSLQQLLLLLVRMHLIIKSFNYKFSNY